MREIIFEMPKTYGIYRVVCRFGYDNTIPYAWWGHLQKQIEYRFLFKKKIKWVEVDRCWWSSEFNSINELKKNAEKFYDEKVELLPRILNKAINLK